MRILYLAMKNLNEPDGDTLVLNSTALKTRALPYLENLQYQEIQLFLDIPSSEYKTIAARLKNSRLDCTLLERFGILRPSWKLELQYIVKQLGAGK